jgi:hypothetical protein
MLEWLRGMALLEEFHSQRQIKRGISKLWIGTI